MVRRIEGSVMKGLILRVSLEEFQVIGAGLQELPYKFSAGLIQNLQGQVNAQIQEAKQPADEAPKE